jgi:hypothetical protein
MIKRKLATGQEMLGEGHHLKVHRTVIWVRDRKSFGPQHPQIEEHSQ